MSDARITFRVSTAAARKIRDLAAEREQTVVGLLRDSFGVMQTAHEAGKEGYYLGLTKIRENLEIALVFP